MQREHLPNLLIAGVPKAGTTSLFAYLAQHPAICAASEKEPGYFMHLRDGVAPRMSIEEYAALFDCPAHVRYRMEATARYVFGGRALIEAVERTLPESRVILSLREPVERLWSAYWSQSYSRRLQDNALRDGLDPEFDSFLARCEAVRDGLVEPSRGDPDWVALRLFQGGHYADWLEAWLDAFGPRLRVVFFDDLRADAEGVTRELLAWLDLDAGVPIDVSVRNRTVSPRSHRMHAAAAFVRRVTSLRTRAPRLDAILTRMYERVNTTRGAPRPLDPETRQRMRRLYEDSNSAVARLLIARGYAQLPGWLRPAEESAEATRRA